MLDSYEILELEKRWKRYNRRRFKRKFLNIITIIIITASVLAALFLLYINLYQNNFLSLIQVSSKEKAITELKQKQEIDKLKQKAILARQKSIQIADKNSAPQEQTVIANKKQPSIVNRLQKIDQTPLQQPNSNIKKLAPQVIGQPTIEKLDILNPLPDEDTIENSINKNSEQPIDFTKNNPTVKKPIKNLKDSIKIQSREISLTIPSLKNQFELTNDIKYAILLSQKYYDEGDYENAMKWSFTVNSIDKDRIEGWIIFAKSKYKIGKKNDALKVLDAVKEKQPSDEIDSLIRQIKMGTL